MTSKRRCAIYTRKSTEDGLDQAFNSLDAQRDACAAYIMSQTHEGWELIDEQYDDGGWSGGNMDRPALKQLLADVASGKVDVIVVYKVDRLTRSLADFARIVDTLDRAGASFVSVTQAFNTTSSMGRLTLNVLLSFAQFEREVTSERIRDKIAASKRKGIFMGGPIPIGYRLESRKLIIDVEEAATVRLIFERYLAQRSIGQVVDELASRGVRTKIRPLKDGRSTGGVTFYPGPLAALLKNPVYVGKVAHAGVLYEGEHEAIIEEARWAEVQALLASNRHARKLGTSARNPSLLTGLLRDPDGRAMSPTFTSKGNQRHHYYVTRLKPGEDRKSIWRVPAGEVDRGVLVALGRWLSSSCEQVTITSDGSAAQSWVEQRAAVAEALPGMAVAEQRALLLEHQVGVQLCADRLLVTLGNLETPITMDLPARLAHRGSEVKLVIPSSLGPERQPDPILLKLVVLARVAQMALATEHADPLVSHYSKGHLSQLLRISWLAPGITAAIVNGDQPSTLTGRRLLRAAELPLDWKAQRTFLGFN